MDPQALEDLRSLPARHRSKILDLIQSLLGSNPTILSKSRIKKLTGIETPQYRMRVDEFRVFYDVSARRVHVLRVTSKEEADEYLRSMGYEPENG
jgi:mRNA interferase RelE/StbE